MKVKNLVEDIRNISGYKELPTSNMNTHVSLVNSNMIFKGINEAMSFIDSDIMPNEFIVPLSINVKTDMIGGDLLKLKLSSYNSGSKPSASSTVKWKDMLDIPWKLLSSGIDSIKQSSNINRGWFQKFGNRIITDPNEYISLCGLGDVGVLSVNKIKSSTLVYDNLSTLKTVFEIEDSKGNHVGEYSVSVNTNVFKFSLNFVDISINYSTGVITASYRGSDSDEYTIRVRTLYHPGGVFYFNNGNLRVSKINYVYSNDTTSIRIRPYAIYDKTQDIPSIYTNRLMNILSFKSALEIQRFKRSIDQNLVNIVYNKISDYSNKERFETMGSTNDLNYIR